MRNTMLKLGMNMLIVQSMGVRWVRKENLWFSSGLLNACKEHKYDGGTRYRMR